jgi:pimeloyl-ACP methyl ester carboxylesterase
MHCTPQIQGHLDPSWSDRFGGFRIEQQEAGATLLSGSLPDQAALHGLLLQVEQGTDPKHMARRIVQLATSAVPRCAPLLALAGLLVALRHWLPPRLFEQVRRWMFQFGAEDPYLDPGVAHSLHEALPTSDLSLLPKKGHYNRAK